MTVQLLVNGSEISCRRLSIIDEGKGKLTFLLLHTVNVNVGDTVEVKVDGSTIAKGKVTKIVTERKHHRKVVYCIGRTDILYREVVLDKDHRVYANQDAGAIVKDLIDHYFSGVLTSNNVNTATGTTINRIDGYGKTVGDVIEELAERAGCCFYVDNDDDVHFFVEGAESTGLTINESDVIDLRKTEWGEVIGKVTVEGRGGVLGSAGSGIPHIYVHDRRVRSSNEAEAIAQKLLNVYNQPRKSAEMKLYGFWNLKTEKTVTVNLPNDGYNNTAEIIRRVQWDFRGKTCFTTVNVGDRDPAFEEAVGKILRALKVKHDDLGVYGERQHFRWSGESTQGYTISTTGSASLNVSAGVLHEETGTSELSRAWLRSGDQNIDFQKNPSFKCKVRMGSNTNQEAYLRIVEYGDLYEAFGFRILDNQLYGFSRGYDPSTGTTNSSNLDLNTTFNAGDTLILEAVYTYNQRIEFYVNGELKGVKTNDLPQGGVGSYPRAQLIDVWIINNAAENKVLDVYYWVAEQDW